VPPYEIVERRGARKWLMRQSAYNEARERIRKMDEKQAERAIGGKWQRRSVNVIVETSGGVDSRQEGYRPALVKIAEGAGGGFSSLKEVATGALREVGSLAVDALGAGAPAPWAGSSRIA
jgi:hypothetical protein